MTPTGPAGHCRGRRQRARVHGVHKRPSRSRRWPPHRRPTTRRARRSATGPPSSFSSRVTSAWHRPGDVSSSWSARCMASVSSTRRACRLNKAHCPSTVSANRAVDDAPPRWRRQLRRGVLPDHAGDGQRRLPGNRLRGTGWVGICVQQRISPPPRPTHSRQTAQSWPGSSSGTTKRRPRPS
jgi:hypothetical protein